MVMVLLLYLAFIIIGIIIVIFFHVNIHCIFMTMTNVNFIHSFSNFVWIFVGLLVDLMGSGERCFYDCDSDDLIINNPRIGHLLNCGDWEL